MNARMMTPPTDPPIIRIVLVFELVELEEVSEAAVADEVDEEVGADATKVLVGNLVGVPVGVGVDEKSDVEPTTLMGGVDVSAGVDDGVSVGV